jgi:hypothetical protein
VESVSSEPQREQDHVSGMGLSSSDESGGVQPPAAFALRDRSRRGVASKIASPGSS